jgi:hypothetical protein
MKTASEVAEEILGAHWDDLSDEKIKSIVAKALTAFAEERVKEALGGPVTCPSIEERVAAETVRCGLIMEKSTKESWAKGRAEGLEEAITAIEYQLGNTETEDPYFSALHKWAISVLRALKDKQ